MQIIIEPAPGNRYNGTLIIDGQVIGFVNDKRPGCCARTLMNKLLLEFGKPSEQITIDINGW
jgi:hypothetical protein